jgi:hypothetical protein
MRLPKKFDTFPLSQNRVSRFPRNPVCVTELIGSPVRTDEGDNMANVFVQARPKGVPDGSPIEDYVVEDREDRELATFKTQNEAIEWAEKQGHRPLVTRMRHLNDKRRYYYWR